MRQCKRYGGTVMVNIMPLFLSAKLITVYVIREIRQYFQLEMDTANLFSIATPVQKTVNKNLSEEIELTNSKDVLSAVNNFVSLKYNHIWNSFSKPQPAAKLLTVRKGPVYLSRSYSKLENEEPTVKEKRKRSHDKDCQSGTKSTDNVIATKKLKLSKVTVEDALSCLKAFTKEPLKNTDNPKNKNTDNPNKKKGIFASPSLDNFLSKSNKTFLFEDSQQKEYSSKPAKYSTIAQSTYTVPWQKVVLKTKNAGKTMDIELMYYHLYIAF